MRAVASGIRKFILDARRYRSLQDNERHLFWKRLQAGVFIALMPAFILAGLFYRLLGKALRFSHSA